MFTRQYLLASDWYRERLEVKQSRDIDLWERHVSSLRQFLDDVDYADEAQRLGIEQRLEKAVDKLRQVRSREYLEDLVGTLGADPLQPAACVSENQIINWNMAKRAFSMDKAVDEEPEPLPSQKIPSLLQKFKTRFRRSRLH